MVVTGDKSEDELVKIVASVNQYSEHPLAEAVMRYASKKNSRVEPVDDFNAVTGKGVTGKLEGKDVAVGNKKLMEHVNVEIIQEIIDSAEKEQSLGKTVSFISVAGKIEGYVCISDAIKPSSSEAIKTLMNEGIDVVMFTGDNKHTAKAVAGTLGLKHFKADCLPEDKLKEIKKLQAEGKVVAMAGDGINDAPALAQASIGIAMGTGTDVAIESSQITLIKGDLQGIVKARMLSQGVMGNIKQNLFFAFVYNALGIPVAAGVLYPAFGILLSPMIAAVAMSLSSVSVIVNSLRIKGLKL
jgi:Cu2+-exporting ATPase